LVWIWLVARCQSEAEAETEVAGSTEESSDLGIVNDDTQIYGDDSFSPAPGVETVCVFPKNSGKCTSDVLPFFQFDFSSLYPAQFAWLTYLQYSMLQWCWPGKRRSCLLASSTMVISVVASVNCMVFYLLISFVWLPCQLLKSLCNLMIITF